MGNDYESYRVAMLFYDYVQQISFDIESAEDVSVKIDLARIIPEAMG